MTKSSSKLSLIKKVAASHSNDKTCPSLRKTLYPSVNSIGQFFHSSTVSVVRSSDPHHISYMTTVRTSSSQGYDSDESLDFCEVDLGPKCQSTYKTSNDNWIKKASKKGKENTRIATSKL